MGMRARHGEKMKYTNSYVPSAHNDHIVSVIKPSVLHIENSHKVMYRGIRLNRAVQLHRCSPFLDDLGVFPMKTSLLVLLHPSNFFLKPVTCKSICKIRELDTDLDLPLLGSLVFVGVTRWCQTVRKGCFLFNSLSTSHIGTDNRRITNNFYLPIPINLSIELVTAMKN
jgi:hypothetical protein